MKNDEIVSMKVGKNEANIETLFENDKDRDNRLKILESYIALQKLTIAKCTAIWGFIIAIVTAIGGFIVYNFVKVKLAIVAAFHAFYEGN